MMRIIIVNSFDIYLPDVAQFPPKLIQGNQVKAAASQLIGFLIAFDFDEVFSLRKTSIS